MTVGKTLSLAIRPVAYVRLFGLALGLLLLFPLGVASFVAGSERYRVRGRSERRQR